MSKFDASLQIALSKEQMALGYALEAIRELNWHCLAALASQAAESRAIQPALIGKLKPLWADLSPEHSSFAAAVPFLLVDMGFGHPRLWESLSVNRMSAVAGVPAFFPEAKAKFLARGTLMLARTITRHHARHGGPLLGIAPEVSRLVAQLSLSQLEHLADHHFGQVKPRWDDRPFVWQHLLQAAIRESQDERDKFSLYGVQLLAGDMSTRPA